MKLVKKTDEYTVYQRRDERYAVKDAQNNPVNGPDKVRILVEEDLIKAAVPAAQPAEEAAPAQEATAEAEAPAAEATAEAEEPAAAAAVAEEAAEAPAADETPAEAAPAEEEDK